MGYYVNLDIASINEETKDVNQEESKIEYYSRLRRAVTSRIGECKNIGMEKLRKAISDNLESGYSRGIQTDNNTYMGNRETINMTPRELSKALGVSYARVASWLSGRRAISTYKIPLLCKMFMNESCHEAIFGAPKTIILPRIPSTIVKTIYSLPLDNSMSVIQALVAKYGVYAHSAENEVKGLVANRLYELADEYNVPITRLHLVNYDPDATTGVWFHVDSRRDQIRRVIEVGNEPTPTRAMELALMLDVPLDYLICEDYTETCEVGYASGDKIIVERRPQVLGLLSIFNRLPDDKKKELFADVVAEEVAQKIEHRTLVEENAASGE